MYAGIQKEGVTKNVVSICTKVQHLRYEVLHNFDYNEVPNLVFNH